MLYNNILNNSFKVIAVESYILIILTALLIFCVVYSQSANGADINIMTPTINLFVLTLVFAFLIGLCNPFTNVVTFNHTLISNDVTSNIKLIAIISTILVLLMSIRYIEIEKLYSFEYVILIGFSLVGMLLLISSFDMLTIYLSIELQSLSFYILASIKRNSEYSTESGFKYFILGALASGFMLFGFSLLYGLTGTTSIENIYKIFITLNEHNSYTVYISLIMILSGLLFKLGSAPFHTWIPDVYEGAPTTITAFFAIVPKIVMITVIFRLFSYYMYDYYGNIQTILIICSILSMVIPTFAALVQSRIKRLFAYSTIAHVGYMLIGISSGSIEGVQSTLVYIIIYIIMSVGLFSIILSIRKNSNDVRIKYINELSNLSNINPALAISLVLLLFSFTGIPPLAGFFSKLYIFSSAINVQLYLLTFIAVLTSVVGSVYYIYLIKIMYFEKDKPFVELRQIDKINACIISVSVLFSCLFCLDVSTLMLFTHKLALLF